MDASTARLLRHFLAVLAYRTQKALRGAPAEFGAFIAARHVRSPHSLVHHMSAVIGFVLLNFTGTRPSNDPLDSFEAEVARFHARLEELARHLERGSPVLTDLTADQLLQGPLADAMTHVGQLALLRRLAGSPVPPENFVAADIRISRLGPDQPAPAAPASVWPEAPDDWPGRKMR